MLFSQIIPRSPSPTESRSLFFISVGTNFLACRILVPWPGIQVGAPRDSTGTCRVPTTPPGGAPSLSFSFYFFHLFLLVGGYWLYKIVLVFVIHRHELALDIHVFPIPIPPPTSLSTPSLWVFPVHQARALVSCIQPGLVICFTLDNIHVSMLFSQIIPPLPSPTESKSLFCTSVSFCFAYRVITTTFLNSRYMC